MKLSIAVLALVGGTSAKWEKCEFKKMARVFFKDDACKEIDWALTKEIDKKFGPISWATQTCGWNPGMNMSLESACTADSVTFWGFEDKKCQPKSAGKKIWTGWFNKCVKKMILYNKAKPMEDLYSGKAFEVEEAKKIESPQTSKESVGCSFPEMDRVFYKDDDCTEIDYDLTKKIDDFYYPVKYYTETCGCSSATGKCHTSTCSADAVTFKEFDIQDNTCKGEGKVGWYAPFNKCVNKMILHNKAAPGYKAPNMIKELESQEKVDCHFKQQARVFYKDEKCTEIDWAKTKETDAKYYPISYATETCGCNAATGKCHTSTCTENAVTFKAFDMADKKCQGQGFDFWKAWFNKCVDKMIVHNRAAPGFKDPGHGLVPGGPSAIKDILGGVEKAFSGMAEKAMDKFSEIMSDDEPYDFLN